MTTNARDEKWSSWIPVYRESDMPKDEGSWGQWKGDDGFVSDEIDLCGVGYSSSFRTVTAYRCKIKEPESDMHPDLKWLATNVSEWVSKENLSMARKSPVGSEFYDPKYWPYDDGYTMAQWLQARRDLGLVTSPRSQEINQDEEEAFREIEKRQEEARVEKYSAYFKDVSHLNKIDVYRAVELFGCEKHGHAISHAAKKLLLTGVRTGGKGVEQEVSEAIDTLQRWLEMREEDKVRESAE